MYMERDADRCLASITESKRGRLATESPSRCVRLYVFIHACMYVFTCICGFGEFEIHFTVQASLDLII